MPPLPKFLWYVPRLVNVVSLAEAVPAEGSGVTLIRPAHDCGALRGAFYAPPLCRGAAFSQPRSRISLPCAAAAATPRYAESSFDISRVQIPVGSLAPVCFPPVALALTLRSRSRFARGTGHAAARRHRPRQRQLALEAGVPSTSRASGTADLSCSLPACLTFGLAMQR